VAVVNGMASDAAGSDILDNHVMDASWEWYPTNWEKFITMLRAAEVLPMHHD
jgi:hypothetical protein